MWALRALRNKFKLNQQILAFKRISDSNTFNKKLSEHEMLKNCKSI